MNGYTLLSEPPARCGLCGSDEYIIKTTQSRDDDPTVLYLYDCSACGGVLGCVLADNPPLSSPPISHAAIEAVIAELVDHQTSASTASDTHSLNGFHLTAIDMLGRVTAYDDAITRLQALLEKELTE